MVVDEKPQVEGEAGVESQSKKAAKKQAKEAAKAAKVSIATAYAGGVLRFNY